MKIATARLSSWGLILLFRGLLLQEHYRARFIWFLWISVRQFLEFFFKKIITTTDGEGQKYTSWIENHKSTDLGLGPKTIPHSTSLLLWIPHSGRRWRIRWCLWWCCWWTSFWVALRRCNWRLLLLVIARLSLLVIPRLSLALTGTLPFCGLAPWRLLVISRFFILATSPWRSISHLGTVIFQRSLFHHYGEGRLPACVYCTEPDIVVPRTS